MSLKLVAPSGVAIRSARAMAIGIALIALCCCADVRAADERLPLPDAATRKEHEKSVDEVFGKQIAAANTAAAKLAVAEEILRIAGEENDANQRYVMLNRVRTLSCAAGDPRLALRAVNELVQTYRIERGRAELATLQSLSNSITSPNQQLMLADSASSMLEEAVARDELESAAAMGKLAFAAARKSGNTAVQQRLSVRVKELQSMVLAAEKLQPFREQLNKNPEDAEANLALGRYYCFLRNDWDTGLPMLAKAGESAIQAAAARELSKTKEDKDLIALADQWWSLSEQEDDTTRRIIQDHARLWYRKALPGLSGLVKARAEKRLKVDEEQVAKQTPVEARPAKDTRPPAIGTSSAQRALLEYVAAQVKAKNTVSSKEEGFTLGKEVFSLVPEEGQLLIGLDVSIGTFNKISGIRPIFLSQKGQVPGPIVGEASTKGARLLAKKGYAIGAIIVKGGIGIDGVSVTFMRIEENGLNPQDAYDTPAFGNSSGGTVLGGDGAPLVGLIGHRDPRSVSALGVVQVAKNAE